MRTESNWAEMAVKHALDLVEQDALEIPSFEKKAFDIGIGSGAIIGGLLSAGVTSKLLNNKKEQNLKKEYGNTVQRLLNEQNQSMLDSGNDYYSQIKNMANDLKVLFTPFSVIFKLKTTVVDTIGTDMMTAQMKEAFKNRDAEYFKRHMVNRVYLDAQEAEQIFIKRMIEQNRLLAKDITKKASELSTTEYSDEYNIFEVLAGANELIRLFDKAASSEALKKYANTLCSVCNTFEDIVIDAEVMSSKYAGDDDLDLGMAKISFFLIGDKEAPNVEVMSPESLKRGLEISYLPDRVLYLKDNVVITTKNVSLMSDDEFEQFKSKNDNFFKQQAFSLAKSAGFFTEDIYKEALTNINSDFLIKDASYDSQDSITEDLMPLTYTLLQKDTKSKFEPFTSSEKTAAVIDEYAHEKELFSREDLSPIVYNKFLTDKYTTEWYSWDTDMLEGFIKEHYGVDSIPETTLNKIMFLVILHNADSPLTGFHTFEKMVRAFNNMTIDFESRESSFSAYEIIATLRDVQEIIRYKDINIYDDISDHVYNYIVEVLADHNFRGLWVKPQSKQEEMFLRLINTDLLNYWVNTLPEGLNNTDADAEASGIQQVITEGTKELLNKEHTKAVAESGDLVAKIIKNSDFDGEFPYYQIIKNNILLNIGADYALLQRKESTLEQLKQF